MAKSIGDILKAELEGKQIRDENGEIYTLKNLMCTPKRFGGIRKIFYTAKYEDKEIKVVNLAESYLSEHELLDSE
ncbi:hypothetical protein GF378_01475 [Candidatus Pacearchaeota archaeon]|nr:hypothetical protein [Candidatus Pacearchaeota archaeon]